MDDANAGRTQGEISGDSGGVDPTRPIGPGNPPRSGTWQAGHSGNPDGMKKGARHMRLILKDILDSEQAMPEERRKIAAQYLGKQSVEDLTTREMLLLSQLDRALKGSTPAFLAIAKISGEYVEKIEGLDGLMAGQVILLRPGTTKVNLDDFKDNPEAMEALLAEAAEEAKAKEQQ